MNLSKRLFIGGVSHDTTKAEIQRFFEDVGTVVQVYCPKDPARPEKNKGFAFVEMATTDEAMAVIELKNGKLGPCGKRAISVKVALDSEGYNKQRTFTDHATDKYYSR